MLLKILLTASKACTHTRDATCEVLGYRARGIHPVIVFTAAGAGMTHHFQPSASSSQQSAPQSAGPSALALLTIPSAAYAHFPLIAPNLRSFRRSDGVIDRTIRTLDSDLITAFLDRVSVLHCVNITAVRS